MVGVAMQLLSFFKLQCVTPEEAKQRIYLVDSQGLIFDSRGPMAEHKKCRPSSVSGHSIFFMTGDVDFSRKDYNGPPLTNLTEIIEYVKPTALFGLSTIKVIVHNIYLGPLLMFRRAPSVKRSSKRWQRALSAPSYSPSPILSDSLNVSSRRP